MKKLCMKKLCLSLSFFLSLSLAFLSAQDFTSSLEIAVANGLNERTNVRASANVVEGFRFGGLFLGAGVGFAYADGLETEIHHVRPDGTIEAMNDNRIYDVSWAPTAFLRAKINFTKTIVSPYLVCDGGYSVRIGSKVSARMNTGWFVHPGVGCDFRILGQSLYAFVSYDRFQYEYEILYTPHSDSDPVNRSKGWSEAFGLHFGISF